jgi:hypothetical protein
MVESCYERYEAQTQSSLSITSRKSERRVSCSSRWPCLYYRIHPQSVLYQVLVVVLGNEPPRHQLPRESFSNPASYWVVGKAARSTTVNGTPLPCGVLPHTHSFAECAASWNVLGVSSGVTCLLSTFALAPAHSRSSLWRSPTTPQPNPTPLPMHVVLLTYTDPGRSGS